MWTKQNEVPGTTQGLLDLIKDQARLTKWLEGANDEDVLCLIRKIDQTPQVEFGVGSMSYKPARDLIVADVLRRFPVQEGDEDRTVWDGDYAFVIKADGRVWWRGATSGGNGPG